jgi:hypothetical protein
MSADLALGCLCGKHMIEETCLWCGHGEARAIVEFAYRRNMEGNVSAVFTTPKPDARVVAISRARSHTWDEDSAIGAALAEEARTGRFPSSGSWQTRRRRGEHRPTYDRVRVLFGSWAAFKRACALVPREQVAA